jgi:signal transduction histidine kinase
MAIFACNVFAQKQNVDSLINVLETKSLTRKEQLGLYEQICNAYRHNSIDGVLKYSQKGLELAKIENDKKIIADFYRYAGAAYELNGNIDTAIAYYKKGLELAIETGYKKCESMLYRNLGFLFISHREYDIDKNTVFDYYLKALKISDSINDKETLITTLLDISAFTYYVLGDNEQAAYYIQRAMKVEETLSGDYMKARIYHCLSDIEEDVDKSIDYNLKGLEIARKTENKYYESVHLQSLGFAYCLDKKEYDKAEKYATECLKVAEEYGHVKLLISAWTVLSYVYIYQRRYEECKTLLLKAWEIDSFNVNLSTLTNLAAAYLYTGQLDEAHEFFKEYTYRLEANIGKESRKNIAEMQIKYETEKKNMQINEFEKERKLYTWIFVVSVVVVLLVLVLLYFRQRLNKQKIKQLEQEKQLIVSQAIIDGEAAERTRLARDLHDGLGGMLSVVKLNLKDMKGYSLIENTDVSNFNRAVEMLDRSIVELRRVSHHIMPDLSNGLQTPLEDFCRSIPEANFRFFGDDSHLDNRLKITVYRCAHELINNAIKHARATAINVQLMIEGKLISLSVQDDGIGFAPEKAAKGLGLESINARVAMYNGKVNIYSSPEKGGTEVNIEIELV